MSDSLISLFPELDEYSSLINSYENDLEFSLKHPDLFWGKIAKARLEWFEDFTEVCNTRNYYTEGFNLKWFKGGKLNASVNCVDRHYLKTPNKIAIIWEKDEPGTQEYFTYEQLYKTMNQIANMYKSYGIKKGDCVSLYVQLSFYAVAAVLACARLGIIHNCIYTEFSPEAIALRINEAQSVAIIVDNEGRRNGKSIEIKSVADEAIKKSPTIKHMFVIDRTDYTYETNEEVINLKNEMVKFPSECEPEKMDSEDILFINFTSGSTGRPKAIVHTHCGFLLIATAQFRRSELDTIVCGAVDIAWIGGHNMVIYGPLINGCTSVLFDASYLYPNPGRYWETIERLNVSMFGTNPTLFRTLMKYDNNWVTRYNRSSLRAIYAGGEPSDEKLQKWLFEVVGDQNITVVNAWGSTELSGALLVAVIQPNQPFKVENARPFFGIDLVVLDDEGKECRKTNSEGILCLKSVWPGTARTLLNDHEKYIDTYLKPYPGYFYTGDYATTDSDGNFYVTGRSDDLIKTRAYRVGSAELEKVVNSHQAIVESAVVSTPHEILGWSPYIFAVPNENNQKSEEEILSEIQEMVKSKIAAYFTPTHLLLVSYLPKTLTGKIVRKILRKISENKLDDMNLDSVENKSCIQIIIEKHRKKYAA